MLVAGEPGVGKTRLAEETAGRARDLGMTCAWGRATDEAGSPPYWPFRQVLQALSGSTGPRAGEPEAAGPRLDNPLPDSAAAERFRLFETVTDGLRAAAAPAGLLVVLDDIQWADLASVQLLVHLAMGVATSRLVVLATYRHTETEGQEPLRTALAELGRESLVSRLRLEGLTEAEVQAQLSGMTGWTVPDSVAAAVAARTHGNPFFVSELGRLLASTPEAPSGNGELPDGIRDAVRARLGRLSPACRSAVSAAAVLGSDVDAAALAAATGRELDEVLAALDEATAAGVLTGSEVRRFAHDLIREAARLDVPTAERLALHRRMAEYLSALGDAHQRVAEVAFHRLESLPAGDAALAVSWAERAAGRAMAQLAWEEAESLYRRAVAAGSGGASTPAHRSRLLLARAKAQVRAYDMDGARRSLLDAAEIARAAGDFETIAHAALIMEGASDVVWDTTNRALCEEALAGIPDGDSALRARLLAQLVAADLWRSPDDAEARSAEALLMAERIGDLQAVVAALRARQLARSGPDGARDRQALGDRLLAVGRDGSDNDAVLWGRLWRFDALAQLGQIDQAEAETSVINVLAERMRSPLVRWHAVRCQAAIALARGRFADARALGRQTESLALRAAHPGALVPSQGFLVNVAIQTGDTDAVRSQMLDPEAAGVVMASGFDALWRLAIGQRDEARRIYTAMAAISSVPRFMLLSVLATLAELADEFDDRETAAEVYRRMSPYADLFACGGAGVIAVNGSARLGLGIAAGTIGKLDDAVRHLRTAKLVNEGAGMPAFAAHATYQLARVLARRRRPGDAEEAASLVISAVAVADRLGMVPLRRRAQELAESLAGQSVAPLTRREQQIAELVSQGLTNRQIAATTFISERTAESHVQHILGKLGFTSRAQIATWVATADGRQIGTGAQ